MKHIRFYAVFACSCVICSLYAEKTAYSFDFSPFFKEVVVVEKQKVFDSITFAYEWVFNRAHLIKEGLRSVSYADRVITEDGIWIEALDNMGAYMFNLLSDESRYDWDYYISESNQVAIQTVFNDIASLSACLIHFLSVAHDGFSKDPSDFSATDAVAIASAFDDLKEKAATFADLFAQIAVYASDIYETRSMKEVLAYALTCLEKGYTYACEDYEREKGSIDLL